MTPTELIRTLAGRDDITLPTGSPIEGVYIKGKFVQRIELPQDIYDAVLDVEEYEAALAADQTQAVTYGLEKHAPDSQEVREEAKPSLKTMARHQELPEARVPVYSPRHGRSFVAEEDFRLCHRQRYL